MMHEAWYHDQVNKYSDAFANEWETFALEISPSPSSCLLQVRALARELIPSWVDSKQQDLVSHGSAPSASLPPHPRLLISRHRQHRILETIPEYLPFSKADFCNIVRKLELPSDCIYARIHGGASGYFALHPRRDDLGRLYSIGITIRAPHSPRKDVKSVWSITLSWDVRSQLTTGIFDGASDLDISTFVGCLNAAPPHCLGHPFLIPYILLDQLGVYYNENWKALGSELVHIERKLGLSRGRSMESPWSWGQDRFRSITYDISALTTGLVYVERQLSFARSFSKYLEDKITIVDRLLEPDKQRTNTTEHLQEMMGNSIPFLDHQLHQVLCLQKRSEALTQAVYTIIAQISNDTNIQIGVAAKHDSTSMKSIAVLTALFLPGTFISSLFGMNFFLFHSAGIQTSSDFWRYWAFTIPVTLFVLLVWKAWVYSQDKPFQKSLNIAGARKDVPEQPHLRRVEADSLECQMR